MGGTYCLNPIGITLRLLLVQVYKQSESCKWYPRSELSLTYALATSQAERRLHNPAGREAAGARAPNPLNYGCLGKDMGTRLR